MDQSSDATGRGKPGISGCSSTITTQIVGVQQLAAFPMSGRPSRVPSARELVISNTPFIAAYAIDQDRIVILAVYHDARGLLKRFLTCSRQHTGIED
jgi:hypothetical protein